MRPRELIRIRLPFKPYPQLLIHGQEADFMISSELKYMRQKIEDGKVTVKVVKVY